MGAAGLVEMPFQAAGAFKPKRASHGDNQAVELFLGESLVLTKILSSDHVADIFAVDIGYHPANSKEQMIVLIDFQVSVNGRLFRCVEDSGLAGRRSAHEFLQKLG